MIDFIFVIIVIAIGSLVFRFVPQLEQMINEV